MYTVQIFFKRVQQIKKSWCEFWSFAVSDNQQTTLSQIFTNMQLPLATCQKWFSPTQCEFWSLASLATNERHSNDGCRRLGSPGFSHAVGYLPVGWLSAIIIVYQLHWRLSRQGSRVQNSDCVFDICVINALYQFGHEHIMGDILFSTYIYLDTLVATLLQNECQW